MRKLKSIRIAAGVCVVGTFILCSAVALADGRILARQPYKSEIYDFGLALGGGWTQQNLALAEVFAGIRAGGCGVHCHNYLDLQGRGAVRDGQTFYIPSVGLRFQFEKLGSSFGPYLRPFLGVTHALQAGRDPEDALLGGASGGFYYYLHPAADLRVDLMQGFGKFNWTALTVGSTIRFGEL